MAAHAQKADMPGLLLRFRILASRGRWQSSPTPKRNPHSGSSRCRCNPCPGFSATSQRKRGPLRVPGGAGTGRFPRWCTDAPAARTPPGGPGSRVPPGGVRRDWGVYKSIQFTPLSKAVRKISPAKASSFRTNPSHPQADFADLQAGASQFPILHTEFLPSFLPVVLLSVCPTIDKKAGMLFCRADHPCGFCFAVGILMNVLIQVDQRIFPGTEAQLRGRLHVWMPWRDSMRSISAALPSSGGMVHRVHTGLVHGHRVQRGKDADVRHLRIVGIGIAVAVHAQAVGHVDVDDVFRPMKSITDWSASAMDSRKESWSAVKQSSKTSLLAELWIWIFSPARRSHADGHVFQRAAQGPPWRAL